MRRTVLCILALLALLLPGCGAPVEGLTGEYESERVDMAPARLSLRADGGGALVVGAEEAPFRWEARGEGQLVLHTRQGGALVVRRTSGNALELDMPGAGRLKFRKKAS